VNEIDQETFAEAARIANESARKVEHSFRAMAQAFMPALRAFGEQLAIVGRAIEEATDQAYEDAGRPCGPSREDKWRWLEEMAERERMREAYCEVEAWRLSFERVAEARERAEEARDGR
jgi:hypothetical protein